MDYERPSEQDVPAVIWQMIRVNAKQLTRRNSKSTVVELGDLIQQGIMAYLQARDCQRHQGRSYWELTIRGAMYRCYRTDREGRNRRMSYPLTGDELAESPRHIEPDSLMSCQFDTLYSAIDRLTPVMRQAVETAYFVTDTLSPAEVGAELGLKPYVAKKRIYSGIKRLRQLIGSNS